MQTKNNKGKKKEQCEPTKASVDTFERQEPVNFPKPPKKMWKKVQSNLNQASVINMLKEKRTWVLEEVVVL